MIGSKLSALVEELSKLSLQHYPDLPASMYIERVDPDELHRVVGFEVPDELKQLYCTAKLMTEPWQKILLSRPSEIAAECAQYNDHVRNYSPHMRVESGVRSPAIFGDKLIPFGYYDDSLYCVDMRPDLGTGGSLKQIVNVSFKKGLAKVVFPNLEAFLADGLKKMRREIKQEAQREAEEQERARNPPVMSAHEQAQANEAMRIVHASFQEAFARMAAWHEQSAMQQGHTPVLDDAPARARTLIDTNPQRQTVQRLCAQLIARYAADSRFHSNLGECLPPMPKAKRERIEKALRIRLPQDLHDFLDAHQSIGIEWDNVVWLGLDDDVLTRCKQLRHVGMTPDDWALWPGTAVPEFGKGLLPMGGDGDPVICYDLNPGAGGVIGQLVEVSFEEAACKVIASSIEDFLKRGLDDLAAGLDRADQ